MEPPVGGVRASSAKLWASPEPKDVVTHLKELHGALLQQAEAYDPSDVFLAIQAACLRWPLEKEEGSPSSSLAEEKELWNILRGSIIAVSALARAYVGPAWWQQAYQRRHFRSRRNHLPHRHRQSTTAAAAAANTSTADDDSSNNASSLSVHSSTVASPVVNNGHGQVQSPNTNRSSTNANDSTGNDNSNHNNNISWSRWSPSIPEILPAAMLRLAANATEKAIHFRTKLDLPMTEQMKLMEAQLVIIQQLCCARKSPIAELDHEFHEWNIPGAHEAVGKILAYSLKLLCTGRSLSLRPSECDNNEHTIKAFLAMMDQNEEREPGDGPATTKPTLAELPPCDENSWKNILLLMRATNDLLAAGWRPLVRDNMADDVVLSLLVIASRGIKLDTSASVEASSKAVREERLVASSCAAEAISALTYLVQKGLIPVSLQNGIVRNACRLYVVLTSTAFSGASLMHPNIATNRNQEEEVGGEEDIGHQTDIFVNLREQCLSEIWELLWGMLGNEASVEASMEVCFAIVAEAKRMLCDQGNGGSPLFNKLKWNDQTDDSVLMDCTVIIRILSSALWGIAPDFVEIPLLRIFWHDTIQAIGRLLSTIYANFSILPRESEDGGKSSPSQLARSGYFDKQVRPLVVESIVAFRRIVDIEVRGGSGILSAVEWDAVVYGIEHSVAPWLASPVKEQERGTKKKKSKRKHVVAGDDIRLETESFLMRVGELLENCAGFDSAPLMDYSCLRKLHVLLLHDLSPLILDKGKARVLALSAVRSWAKFGFFPYRLTDWSDTALELLVGVFSVDRHGRYLHSPAVRLEALKSLTFEVEKTPQAEEEDSLAFPPHSLLRMTRNMRELHLDIVSKCIVPILSLVLLGRSTSELATIMKGRHDEKNICDDISAGDSSIQLPKISGTEAKEGDKSRKAEVEHLLAAEEARPAEKQTEGVEQSPNISCIVPVADSAEEAVELELYAVRLVGRLFLNITVEHDLRSLFITMLQSAATGRLYRKTRDEPPLISIRLEGLHQLDLCLNGCFANFPYAHKSVPALVEAICSVLKSGLMTMRDHDGRFEKGAVLGIAAARMLGRLRLHANNTLALVPYPTAKSSSVDSNDPDYLPGLLNSHGQSPVELNKDDKVLKISVASFVRVQEDGGHKTATDRTIFSFQPVANDVFEILSKTPRPATLGARAEQLELYSLLRKSCFEVLRKFLLSGVRLTLPNETAGIFTTSMDEIEASECSEEMFAMVKTLSNFLQLSLSSKINADASLPKELSDGERCFERPEALGFGIFVGSYKSRDRELVVATCQSLCALVPALEKVAGKSVALDTFRIIQERLNAEVSIFQAFGGTPPKTVVRISTALLAVLYEASWSWERPTEGTMLIKTVQICLDVITSALQLSQSMSLHIALRCLLLAVGKLTPDETAEARRIFYEEHTRLCRSEFASDSEDCNAPIVINEALEQRIQEPASSNNTEKASTPKKFGPFSKHDAMTRESENIAQFAVETDTSRYNRVCVAWLCDHSAVITCRIGSASSRYRGYVEVVIRSPTTRVRKLIPIPSRLTLEDPEMPLRVLSSPLPRRTHETKQPPPVQCPDSFALKYDSSGVINHAQSLLDKFDVMFPQGGTAELVTNTQAETDDDSSQRSQGPSREYEFDTAASFCEEAGSFAPGEEETDASISSIHSASQPDSIFEPAEQSIANWFISVFGLASGRSEDLFQYLGLHDLELSSSLDGFSRLKNYRFREKWQLRYNSKLERAISILDRTTPLNTFKFALLYSGHRHESSEEVKAETVLLKTTHCSPDFHKFASQLGTMTHTRHLKYYSAGLDVSEFESDGKYTIAWSPQESTSTVVFHVIYLLSEGINNRKRHIGNDNVLILFVDKSSDIDLEINSEGDFTRGSSIVSGHFNFATILVTVLPQPGLFRVSCRIRSNIPDELSRVLSDFAGEDLISEVHVADYARGLAMRIDLACRTLLDDGLPPATNSLERCRQIAELKRYAM